MSQPSIKHSSCLMNGAISLSFTVSSVYIQFPCSLIEQHKDNSKHFKNKCLLVIDSNSQYYVL